MKSGFRRIGSVVVLLAACLAAQGIATAHSPVVDACTCDWCFSFVATPTADSASTLSCNLSSNVSPNPIPACECGPSTGVIGEESAWFDAFGDNKVINDVAAVATTSDANMLYFAAALFNDPNPNASIPNAQVAIDVAPGGNTEWRDLNNKLTVKNIGQSTGVDIDPDYLLVFDFSDFPFGAGFVNTYMRVYEATTAPGTWTQLGQASVAVDPGVVGGTGGPPGKIEVGIPWSIFAGCAACPDFGPDTPFQWTLIMPQGLASPVRPFTPTGPIEDLLSEEVAGTYTTTVNSCASGAGSTDCELADGSSDAFIGVGTATASGEVPDGGNATTPLLVNPGAGGTLELTWGASCLAGDSNYEVYTGTIGNFGIYSPLLCSTGGATNATIDTPAGSAFYLIVPTNGSSEGSYGRNSAGAERPASAQQCKPQLFEGC